jgi:hypothetical protein
VGRKDFRSSPWEGFEGFPGPGKLPLAAWEVFRQRKTSHAAGSMPKTLKTFASESLWHGAGGLKKILSIFLKRKSLAFFFKA